MAAPSRHDPGPDVREGRAGAFIVAWSRFFRDSSLAPTSGFFGRQEDLEFGSRFLVVDHAHLSAVYAQDPAHQVAPLYKAMAERGAEVKIVVGHPRPELYFDPETVAPGAQTSLHAKCLVVDRRWALVSSANFTDRGLTRNLEAGVLIEDTTFARRLSEQWPALVDSGQMKPHWPK